MPPLFLSLMGQKLKSSYLPPLLCPIYIIQSLSTLHLNSAFCYCLSYCIFHCYYPTYCPYPQAKPPSWSNCLLSLPVNPFCTQSLDSSSLDITLLPSVVPHYLQDKVQTLFPWTLGLPLSGTNNVLSMIFLYKSSALEKLFAVSPNTTSASSAFTYTSIVARIQLPF